MAVDNAPGTSRPSISSTHEDRTMIALYQNTLMLNSLSIMNALFCDESNPPRVAGAPRAWAGSMKSNRLIGILLSIYCDARTDEGWMRSSRASKATPGGYGTAVTGECRPQPAHPQGRA